MDLSSQPVSTTAQCDRPVDKRTGAWTCPGSVDQQNGDTNKASGDPDLGASEAETGDYCLSFAPECWGVTNDFHAEFNGKNTYGYKDKVLGTVDMETTWQLSGTQSVSKPVIADFSDPVRNVIFETDRLYYNQSHRSGAYFNPPQHDFKTWATAIGQKKWPGRGAVLREGTAYLGGVMQVFSWQVPGYSGTWTTYVKSPQFEKDGDVYRFIGKHNLPQDAWNAYYRP